MAWLIDVDSRGAFIINTEKIKAIDIFRWDDEGHGTKYIMKVVIADTMDYFSLDLPSKAQIPYVLEAILTALLAGSKAVFTLEDIAERAELLEKKKEIMKGGNRK